MSRILVFGDAAHTGFGTVTWNLGTRLLALGEDVRFLSQNQTADPIPHPLGERTWSVDRIQSGAEILGYLTAFKDGWKPEAIVVIGDYAAVRSWVFMAPEITKAFEAVPSFHYCPVEGVGLPPRWAELWNIVRPVAMSEFGADQIESITGFRPPVVYHGVDTDTYYPVAANRPGSFGGKPIVSKDGARQAISYPNDRILALRTDRHMPRKQMNRLLRIFERVFAQNDRVDLVLHCRPIDQGGDLYDSISKLPAEMRDRVKLTRAHDTWRGLSKNQMNVLYNAADIYVTNSAEGFGLTPAEAGACGVPVVAMDYSTLPEVVGPGGVLVPVDHLVDNEYDHSWAAVDEEAFADAVLRLADKPALRRELGKRAAHHVASTFQWDTEMRKLADLVRGSIALEEAA